MRNSPSILPIRPLVLHPVRFGRRQHLRSSVSTPARAGAMQRHLATAKAGRPSWLRGPLFSGSLSQPQSADVRHAA